MEYIEYKDIKINVNLIRELIVQEYLKIFDLNFGYYYHDDNYDEIEARYYSTINSIHEIYNKYIIDYHLKPDEEVSKLICYIIINDYYNYIYNKLYSNDRISKYEIKLLKSIQKTNSISDILDKLNEDFKIFEYIFRIFLDLNLINNKDKDKTDSKRKINY